MKQKGLATVTALFLITVMASLGVAGVTLFSSSRDAATLELQAMRAREAAAGGIEAALLGMDYYGDPHAVCDALPMNVPMPETLAPYTVTVSCEENGPYTDGGTLSTYRLRSVACNRPGTGGVCPNVNAGQNYVEQEAQISVTL